MQSGLQSVIIIDKLFLLMCKTNSSQVTIFDFQFENILRILIIKTEMPISHIFRYLYKAIIALYLRILSLVFFAISWHLCNINPKSEFD